MIFFGYLFFPLPGHVAVEIVGGRAVLRDKQIMNSFFPEFPTFAFSQKSSYVPQMLKHASERFDLIGFGGAKPTLHGHPTDAPRTSNRHETDTKRRETGKKRRSARPAGKPVAQHFFVSLWLVAQHPPVGCRGDFGVLKLFGNPVES